jgi:hypothetical protein
MRIRAACIANTKTKESISKDDISKRVGYTNLQDDPRKTYMLQSFSPLSQCENASVFISASSKALSPSALNKKYKLQLDTVSP